MARQDFQTFEDRRYRRPDSVETARYQAEARQEVPLPSWWQREAMDARRSPSFDEAYRRSDIVLESPTDPTGWKATGPAAPPIDDRVAVALLHPGRRGARHADVDAGGGSHPRAGRWLPALHPAADDEPGLLARGVGRRL